MKTEENKLAEMYVKFWEPYAAEMADKDVDVIERVRAWLPKIDGMTVEQLSPYEVRLHRVPRARTLEIRGAVKARVVDELGWNEEPSHVVLLLAPFYSGWQVMMDWCAGDALDMREKSPFPSDEMIGNVKCPIAIIHGEKDETCLCVRARELYEFVPNKAGFTLVPDAGHCDLLAKLGSVRFREIVSRILAI